MERWGWLVGYVALFTLLHLLLYYLYTRRDDDDSSLSSPVTDGNGPTTKYASHLDGRPGPADDPNAEFDFDPGGETVHCPHCGAKNEADQTYTYCWNCISPVRQ